MRFLMIFTMSFVFSSGCFFEPLFAADDDVVARIRNVALRVNDTTEQEDINAIADSITLPEHAFDGYYENNRGGQFHTGPGVLKCKNCEELKRNCKGRAGGLMDEVVSRINSLDRAIQKGLRLNSSILNLKSAVTQYNG